MLLRLFLGAAVLGALAGRARARVHYKPGKTRDPDRYMIDYFFALANDRLTSEYKWVLEDDNYILPESSTSFKMRYMTGKQGREKYVSLHCMSSDPRFSDVPACPALYAPLCADDGRTYLNACELRCYNMKIINSVIQSTDNQTLRWHMSDYYIASNTTAFQLDVPPAWQGFLRLVNKVRMGPCILGR